MARYVAIPAGLLIASSAMLAGLPAGSRADEPGRVDFRKEVLPILSENCFLCHGPDGGTRKAELRLDTKEGALRTAEPVIVPGKSGESEVFLRVTSHDADEVMPPRKSGKTLTPRAGRGAEEVDRPGRVVEPALGVRAAESADAAAG